MAFSVPARLVTSPFLDGAEMFLLGGRLLISSPCSVDGGEHSDKCVA